MDPQTARRSAEVPGVLSAADRVGLYSLYMEPIYATLFQVTAGGHRITAMGSSGLRR